MKKYKTLSLGLFLLTFLSSCELVEGIFKAGMWTGILLVFLFAGIIIWLFAKLFRGNR